MVGGGDLTLQHLGGKSRRPAPASNNGLGPHATAQTSQAKIESLYFLRNAKNIQILQELSEICRDHSGVHFGETRRELPCSNKPLLTLTNLNLVEIHFSSSIETHQRLLFFKQPGPKEPCFTCLCNLQKTSIHFALPPKKPQKKPAKVNPWPHRSSWPLQSGSFPGNLSILHPAWGWPPA